MDGVVSLWRGNPNMNSLVGIGASTSYLVGAASALLPGLAGADAASFMEEPVMLLGFVLLGRALEARAKVKAAADLRALARLIPATARLALDPGAAPGAPPPAPGAAAAAVEYLPVPTSSVRRGDVLRVLPGAAARRPPFAAAVPLPRAAGGGAAGQRGAQGRARAPAAGRRARPAPQWRSWGGRGRPGW